MNLGQIYTRRRIADFMTRMLTIGEKGMVLDPCFGHGVFVKSLLQNTHYNVMGVEIDEKSFSSFSNPDTSRCKLLCCDFFDLDQLETYDGIIMNPPYVRQEEIDQMAPLGLTKLKVQSACGFMHISTKANLYMYFILRAIMLLRKGGELVAIFPNSWKNTPMGKEFLADILSMGYIDRFITVIGNAFEGAPLVDVCIMKFIRGANGKTTYERLTINDDNLLLEETGKPEKSESAGLVRLRSVASIRRGITTGYNKLFINPPLLSKDHLVDILSSPKNIKGYSTRKCMKDKLLLLSPSTALTEDEKSYIEDCEKLIRKEGRPKTLLSMIEKGQKWYTLSIPPVSQIIFSYIVRNNMKFVLNDANCNVRDNFYMISSRHDPLLLLAMLNNYHIYNQLESKGKSYGKGLLKLQAYDISNLKIPSPDMIDPVDKEALLDAGRTLSSGGDVNQISVATKILDKYYGCSDSYDKFIKQKERRLDF